MDDLQQLFPTEAVITLGDREIVVREMTIKQLPRFLKAAAPFLAPIMDGGDIGASGILEHAEALVQAVSIGTGLEVEWIEERPARDLTRLIEVVIEANAGFFVQALPAFAANMGARLAKMMAGLESSAS